MVSRLVPTIGLTAALLAAAAPPASARIVEVGRVSREAPPSCPSTPCLAVSRTTGYQAKVGSERGIFVVPEDGKLVAWTISLGRPARRQVAFFEEMLGGPASAGITVLRPGSRQYGRVTGRSSIQRLTPYFGQTVQFPLGRALNVRKGYLVALTVPTWAPALAVGFGNDVSWRASRSPGRCQDTQTQTAQTRRKSLARYRCLYRTARLTYSATIVTDPRPEGSNRGGRGDRGGRAGRGV